MKKQKTYFVSIQRTITLRPELLFEAIAVNEADAKRQAQEWVKKMDPKKLDARLMEAAMDDLKDGEREMGHLRLIGCGQASQYHSEKECKLCRQVKKTYIQGLKAEIQRISDLPYKSTNPKLVQAEAKRRVRRKRAIRLQIEKMEAA